MGTHRIQRLEEEVKHALSQIVLFEATNPLIQKVNITRVIVTKDVGLARVYYTMMEKNVDLKLLADTLDKSKGFFRKQLSQKLNLKSVPQVDFFYDETAEELNRVEALFSKI